MSFHTYTYSRISDHLHLCSRWYEHLVMQLTQQLHPDESYDLRPGTDFPHQYWWRTAPPSSESRSLGHSLAPGIWGSYCESRICRHILIIDSLSISFTIYSCCEQIWCVNCPVMCKIVLRKTSHISHTLVGNKIVDNSDVVGASPVGAAPTTSSLST